MNADSGCSCVAVQLARRFSACVEMPALGFGVFQTPPAETVGAVETAIRGATG